LFLFLFGNSNKQIMNPKVDFYFTKASKWQKEIEKLRAIALECNLNEELKWGCPCYTLGKSNVVLIHVFKDYCAYLFFKGALLKDEFGILIQQTENVQAARQLRFTDIREIVESEALIKSYIFEAIEVEKSGFKVELKRTKEYDVPEELQIQLDEDSEFESAFKSLTPGRQRAYLLYFSAAKQSKTREARIEKCKPQIMQGLGLND
jgi:uncharacterized protein YdeI (YjbR/CyaY-like superfamily)